jgi:hypothetical protein
MKTALSLLTRRLDTRRRTDYDVVLSRLNMSSSYVDTTPFWSVERKLSRQKKEKEKKKYSIISHSSP